MRKMLLISCAAVAGAATMAVATMPLAVPARASAAEVQAAALPSGMVAFFAGTSCPTGWGAAPSSWTGRYVVMSSSGSGNTVGTALRPGENRPTGDHTHTGAVSFYGGACPTNPTGNCVRWSDAGAGRGPRGMSGAQPLNDGESIVAGTNAPYVELKACVKR